LERIWKEAAVSQSKYYPVTFLKGLRKVTKNLNQVVGIQAKIRTEHLLNAVLEHCHCTNPLDATTLIKDTL
jgi:hypothetical protein